MVLEHTLQNTSTLPTPRSAAPPPTEPRTRFRRDIEGLRAIAVLLVVAYHVSSSLVRGGYIGVDVFFVISGYLITFQLYRELITTRRISVIKFYSRRMARLLPASLLVAVVTIVATWFWVPPTRFRSIAFDGLSTALYFINYRLAFQGTQYLGASAPPSPLQNYWSLAVEEQYYFVWPAIMLLSSLPWVLGRRKTPNRTTVFAVLLTLAVVSFSLGVWQTAHNAPWAFFGVPFRAWELATGAMVAIASPVLSRMPRAVAGVVSAVGLTLIVVSGLLYNDAMAFPGYAAALPVFATAAVIAAGCREGRDTPTDWLLGRGFFQGIGKVSYSWYLWHWPILIVLPIALGARPSTGFNVLLAIWSLALAGVTYSALENPVRFHWARLVRPSTNIRIGMAASLVIAVAAFGAMRLPLRSLPTGAAVVVSRAGASGGSATTALANLIESSTSLREVPSNVAPPLDEATHDFPTLYRDRCDPPLTSSAVKICEYGDLAATDAVVLFGDSHAGQWFSPLEILAKERHWRLIPFTKNACTAASVTIVLRELKRAYTECAQWRSNVFEAISRLRPKKVIMSSNGDGGKPIGAEHVDEGWATGWAQTYRAISPYTEEVVYIEDTPWPSVHVPDCVAAHPQDVGFCSRPTDESVAKPHRRDLVREAVKAEGGHVIDPFPWFCTSDTCPVIIGNALVFRDSSHISSTYASTLAPVLGEELG